MQKELLKTAVALALERSHKARNSDNYLACLVYRYLGYSTDLFYLANQKDAPSYSSIVRYRRALQKQHAELKATKKVQRYRADKVADYKEIAREIIYLPPRDEQ